MFSESDQIDEVLESTDYRSEELTEVENFSYNFLFEDPDGNFVKLYDNSIIDTIFSFLGPDLEKASKRARNEVIASEKLQEAGLNMPETERLDDRIVRKEGIDGYTLEEAANTYNGQDATDLGRAIGETFRKLEINRFYEPDLGLNDIMIRETSQGFDVVFLDFENFEENSSPRKIRRKSRHIARSLRPVDESHYEKFREGFEEEYLDPNKRVWWPPW